MTFYENLKFYLEQKGLNQAQLAKAIEISPSTITEWKNNKNTPNGETVFRISKFLGVPQNKLVNIKHQQIVLLGDTADYTEEEQEKDVVMVPLYCAEASAGYGREIPDYIDITPIPVLRSFLAPHNPATVKALEIKGDSMIKVGLYDSDIAFYVPCEPRGNGIYVISINKDLMAKGLEFDPLGEEIKIISENDKYSPRTLKGEAMNRLKIEGKVIGWLHKHPY